MLFSGRLPQEERRQERQEDSSSAASAPGRIGLVADPVTVVAWVLALLAVSPALSTAASNESAASEPAIPVSTPQLTNSPMQLSPPDYSKSTDHELTRLGARWDRLSAPEKEALLREVKLRMAQRKDSDGVLMIRTQRRYGRVYSGNGRYLKIETKVIRVRPSTEGSGNSAGFGTGFEQRNAQPTPVEGGTEADGPTSPLDAAMNPPLMRASDPSS